MLDTTCFYMTCWYKEATVAMQIVFADPMTDAITFCPCLKTFNNLNRNAMLYNIPFVCLATSKVLTNCYCGETTPFFMEGTIQDGTLSLMMFALEILLLIHTVNTKRP